MSTTDGAPNQLIEVEAKLLNMDSRLRSLRTLAYFGSLENFGTESCNFQSVLDR
jgi:hypothetical protein